MRRPNWPMRRRNSSKRRCSGSSPALSSCARKVASECDSSIHFEAWLFRSCSLRYLRTRLGLPIPGPLFLLAAGALAAAGKLGFLAVIGLTITACVSADWIWYEAGRRGGDKVLHFMHRFTRDPDFHDRRAKRVFARYGLPLLLVAKFVPGRRRGIAALGRNLAHQPSPVPRLRCSGRRSLRMRLWRIWICLQP